MQDRERETSRVSADSGRESEGWHGVRCTSEAKRDLEEVGGVAKNRLLAEMTAEKQCSQGKAKFLYCRSRRNYCVRRTKNRGAYLHGQKGSHGRLGKRRAVGARKIGAVWGEGWAGGPCLERMDEGW